MVKTNDGFEISEVDMKLRGPGDIMGTRQSGMLNLQIADLMQDGAILKTAREAVFTILKEDPGLDKPEHRAIFSNFNLRMKGKAQWGRIS